MKAEIIYEDSDLLVAYKPAGLATQSGRVGQADLVSELKNYLVKAAKKTGTSEKASYLGVVHRLDQPVEGLLVFGKSQKATAALSAQLSKDILNKTYLALVLGKPHSGEEAKVTLEDYMIKEDGSKAGIVTKETEGAKKAILTCESLSSMKICELLPEKEGLDTTIKDKHVTLVRVELTTGRFHQIRAQMSHAGLPLLGDLKYGSEESLEVSKILGVRNVCLCASTIAFKHPVSGKLLSFEVRPKNPAYGKFGQ